MTNTDCLVTVLVWMGLGADLSRHEHRTSDGALWCLAPESCRGKGRASMDRFRPVPWTLDHIRLGGFGGQVDAMNRDIAMNQRKWTFLTNSIRVSWSNLLSW